MKRMTIVDFLLELMHQHQPDPSDWYLRYYLGVYWHHNWNNQDNWVSGPTLYIPTFEKDLRMFEHAWERNAYVAFGHLKLYRIVTEFTYIGDYYVVGKYEKSEQSSQEDSGIHETYRPGVHRQSNR